MFDIDSRTILVEVDTDVYVLSVILDALPSMAGCIWQDGILKGLYEAMKARVYEMYRENDSKGELEEMLVCGFSAQK